MPGLEQRLDGNAAGGLLLEVFGRDVTAAAGTCAGCGATNVLACAEVYLQAPGTVLRCPACTAVLVCVVRLPGGRLVVDLGGVARIRIEPA